MAIPDEIVPIRQWWRRRWLDHSLRAVAAQLPGANGAIDAGGGGALAPASQIQPSVRGAGIVGSTSSVTHGITKTCRCRARERW